MKATHEDIIQFLQQEFPQSLQKCTVDDIQSKYARVSYCVGFDELRPGGTVSGPTMVTIADFAFGNTGRSRDYGFGCYVQFKYSIFT